MQIVNFDRLPRERFGERGETVPLVNAAVGSKHVDVHINILSPGGPDGAYHFHPENENIYIILRGRGRFVADGEEYMLGQHDVVFIPPGVKHSLSVFGTDELVLIEIYAPLPVATCDVTDTVNRR